MGPLSSFSLTLLHRVGEISASAVFALSPLFLSVHNLDLFFLTKPFDKILYDILISKLRKYGLDVIAIRWVHS